MQKTQENLQKMTSFSLTYFNDLEITVINKCQLSKLSLYFSQAVYLLEMINDDHLCIAVLFYNESRVLQNFTEVVGRINELQSLPKNFVVF